MGIFNFFKNNTKIKGEIGYFGLSKWWLSEFSDDERNYIIETYQPMGTSGKFLLVEGEISSTSQTVISFLSTLASWFNNEQDKTIATKILNKAEELINESDNLLDIHFFYSGQVQMYYKQRDKDPNALEKAIEACKNQIKIAPLAKAAFIKEYDDDFLPRHIGFEQLAIIEEKRKNYDTAINISKEALSQGWNGDWEKRIERCMKKVSHKTHRECKIPFLNF